MLLSQSFRNTNDLQVSREVYRSTGCPGSLGTGLASPESREDCMGTFQPNPLPLWVRLFFFFLVTTAHKKLMAQFMFKHGHGFQRSPLIPSRNQVSSRIQIRDLAMARSTLTKYSFEEHFCMILFTPVWEDLLFPIIWATGHFQPWFWNKQLGRLKSRVYFQKPSSSSALSRSSMRQTLRCSALANVNEAEHQVSEIQNPPSHTTSNIGTIVGPY